MAKRIAIICEGEKGKHYYRILKRMQDQDKVKVVGIVDLKGSFTGLEDARSEGIFLTTDLYRLLSMRDLDGVVETTGNKNILDRIRRINPNVEVMSAAAGSLAETLVFANEHLEDNRLLWGELWTILNSVQEAIEVADISGQIKYVNPAFSRVTGIPCGERVGKNIFEVSPHGALAQSLIRQKPVTGYRTQVGGSEVEVISNAAPIVVDGSIQGGIVVFQPITDILRLMDELQRSTTLIENLYARITQITEGRYTFADLIGSSKIFQATVEMAKQAAKSEATVLITGESGTGKEVYASAIHQGSSRRGRPLVRVNFATIPEALLETEFFGYEKGAFAGAVKTKIGQVELAQGGTLLLNEVGELPHNFQLKLLRLIKSREFQRVGGEETIQADVRIIAATACDLKDLVRRGKFNSELYYYLSIIELNLPSLRQRSEDIHSLANHFIEQYNRKLGKRVKHISPEALQMMSNYDWPGNVRELSNVIERAMATVDEDTIQPHHISPYIGQFGGVGQNFIPKIIPLDKMEQLMLKTALARYGESLEGKKKAAQALNISLATLYNKIKKYKANL